MIRDDILVRYLEALEHGANLDEVTRGNPAAQEELAGFIELKQQLLDLPKNITLPATTKARLRAQLLAEIRQPAVNNAYDFAEWWGRLVDEAHNAVFSVGRILSRPMATAAAVVLAFGVMGAGTVSASLETIPGDGLYPVKTAVEQTRLALSLNEQDRAETHLWIASSRVDELSKIAATGKVELASKVVAEYEQNVAQALQLAVVQSQEEAQFQSRVSEVHTNLQAIYETAPETLQTLLASTLTLTENTADNQPATSATGATPTAQGATNAHGQSSSGSPLPPSKGSATPVISGPTRDGPLSAPPTPGAPSQSPSKGELPSVTGPIPSKDTSGTAPIPSIGADGKNSPLGDNGSPADGDESSQPTTGTTLPGVKDPIVIQGQTGGSLPTKQP